MSFETDESVLFIEVSSIQRCPDREIGSFHCSVCVMLLQHLILLDGVTDAKQCTDAPLGSQF